MDWLVRPSRTMTLLDNSRGAANCVHGLRTKVFKVTSMRSLDARVRVDVSDERLQVGKEFAGSALPIEHDAKAFGFHDAEALTLSVAFPGVLRIAIQVDILVWDPFDPNARFPRGARRRGLEGNRLVVRDRPPKFGNG